MKYHHTKRYVEFLRGTATSDECKPLFEQYEKCLSVSYINLEAVRTSLIRAKRALSERGIDKMLKEVRDDNKENDAEHMKPVSCGTGHDARWNSADFFSESIAYIAANGRLTSSICRLHQVDDTESPAQRITNHVSRPKTYDSR
ncbi:hypothetical protein NX059_003134 [Plenodomus lindquistii]|nr:hypothetical protein NX059_003134 [Plenodomus lindquistii]